MDDNSPGEPLEPKLGFWTDIPTEEELSDIIQDLLKAVDNADDYFMHYATHEPPERKDPKTLWVHAMLLWEWNFEEDEDPFNQVFANLQLLVGQMRRMATAAVREQDDKGK